MFLCVSFHLRAFGTFCNCTKLAAKRAKLVQLVKSSCHDVLLEFSATNAPDQHHWTQNSGFGAFLSVLVHLEPFRYCTKIAAK
jgi:hypothetical protein